MDFLRRSERVRFRQYPLGILAVSACLLLQFFSLSAHASACLDAPKGQRIGLVLSGGGARGSAHVGVLKVLERIRVPIHCIAGTSLGSVVGALHARGLTAQEIEEVIASVDWNRGFVDEFPRERLPLRRKDEEDEFLINFELGVSEGVLNLPLGVVQGHSLHLLLKDLMAGASLIDDFNQLPIPFRSVATDLEKAETVAIGQGDIATAVQASMAIPGVFSPVEIDGRLLIDGGVTQNLPISVVRAMGADVVIAVDIGTPLTSRENLQSVVAILDQLTNVLTQDNVREQKATLASGDVFIQPDLGEHTATDFALASEIVQLGRIAAEQNIDALSAYSLTGEDYESYRSSLGTVLALPKTLTSLKLVQSSKLSTEVLRNRIKTDTDEVFDPEILNDSLNAIHSTGLYERVSYRYVPEGLGTGVVVDASRKTWGPDLVRFGFSLEDDFSGNNNFNISAGYTRKAFNTAGGDLRAVANVGENPGLLLEYFQPLSTLGSAYLLAAIDHEQFSQGAFDDVSQTARYRTRRTEGGLYTGWQFAHHSDLRFGLRLGTGRASRRVGGDDLSSREEFAEGALVGTYRYDTLDSIRFPSRGNRFRLEIESSLDDLGADDEFDAVSLDALIVRKIKDKRWVGSMSVQTVTRGELPVQKRFSRGGLLNTTGLSEDLLVGQHAGRLGVAVYQPLESGQIAALDFPVYVGMSLEFGGVFLNREEIVADNADVSARVFVGADTPVGPVILGIGGTRGTGLDAVLSLGVAF